MMLITNATAYVDGRFHENYQVRVQGDFITDAGPSLVPAAGEETFDLQGDFLLPGFVDVHIHAFRGMDTMAGEEAVRHMSRTLREEGVAAFLPTTMSASLPETRHAMAGVDAVRRRPEPRGAWSWVRTWKHLF